MIIEKLNKNVLKIYLNSSDLAGYNISYSEINVRSIRYILLELADEISDYLDISLENEKLYVEVFSHRNGCMIFVSYIPDKKSRKTVRKNLICQFEDYETLESFCQMIKNLYAESVIDSMLYCNENHIRLYLKLKGEYESIASVSSGYCRVFTANEINNSVTGEYFRIISEENAIEEILACTGK